MSPNSEDCSLLLLVSSLRIISFTCCALSSDANAIPMGSPPTIMISSPIKLFPTTFTTSLVITNGSMTAALLSSTLSRSACGSSSSTATNSDRPPLVPHSLRGRQVSRICVLSWNCSHNILRLYKKCAGRSLRLGLLESRSGPCALYAAAKLIA